MNKSAMGLMLAFLCACEAGGFRGVDVGQASISLSQSPNASNSPAPTSTTPAVDSNMPGNSNTPAVPDPNAPTAPGIAIYWGTGNSKGKDPNFATVCATPQYNIIIISFAYAIGNQTRNAGGYPEMSISGCGGAYNAANPYLPNCSAVGALIPTCQAAGKKVLLSLGGGESSVGFDSDAEAKAYATLMWNLVLGGNGNVRPFGQAILDGIDLDIESGSPKGYGAFVQSLRALMDADGRKKYLITAAPQCVFPDAWMGPDDPKKPAPATPISALSVAPTAFDHLFVQFYNNDCRWANPSYFAATLNQWSNLPIARQPKIWIGLPGAKDAAMAKDLVPEDQLRALMQAGAVYPAYGGIMLWDAGYDLVDAVPGAPPYSQLVAQAQNSLVVAR